VVGKIKDEKGGHDYCSKKKNSSDLNQKLCRYGDSSPQRDPIEKGQPDPFAFPRNLP
jgi:hypothetical protein